jgi:hypothetical protein
MVSETWFCLDHFESWCEVFFDLTPTKVLSLDLKQNFEIHGLNCRFI